MGAPRVVWGEKGGEKNWSNGPLKARRQKGGLTQLTLEKRRSGHGGERGVGKGGHKNQDKKSGRWGAERKNVHPTGMGGGGPEVFVERNYKHTRPEKKGESRGKQL